MCFLNETENERGLACSSLLIEGYTEESISLIPPTPSEEELRKKERWGRKEEEKKGEQCSSVEERRALLQEAMSPCHHTVLSIPYLFCCLA